MAKWKQTLDISDLFEEVSNDETESRVGELCTAIADRLEALIPEAETGQFSLKEFSNQFRELVDDDPDFDKFNYYFNHLYDWADTDKRLWIKVW